jgi:hypothetical protein
MKSHYFVSENSLLRSRHWNQIQELAIFMLTIHKHPRLPTDPLPSDFSKGIL